MKTTVEKDTEQVDENSSFDDLFDEAMDFDEGQSSLMGGNPPVDENEAEEEVDASETDEEKERSDERKENSEQEESGEQIDNEESTNTEGSEEDEHEPPETNKVPETLSNQLKEQFPDKDLTDPDEYSQAITKLAEDSTALEKEREANKKVYDLFDSTPELVDIARKRSDGKSFLEALAATVDIPKAMDELKENDPEEYKKIMKAQARHELELEHAEKEREKMEQEFRDNQEDSKKNIEEFQKEQGLDDTEREAFINTVGNHFGNIVRGEITPEFLNIMHRGLNYDTAVEKAQEEGRIEGRNEKIKRERNKKSGDNLPAIRGGGKPTTTKTTKEADIFDEALQPQKPISEL